MKIEWPERRIIDPEIVDLCASTWNAACDACIAAYEQAQKGKGVERVEWDIKKVGEFIFNLQCLKKVFNYRHNTKEVPLTLNQCEFVASEICSKFSPPQARVVPTEKDVLNSWKLIGSTYHPILRINGKIYYFMNKQELAECVVKLLKGEK